MGSFNDLTGKVYSFLTVKGRVNNKGAYVTWACECICGKVVNVQARFLQNSNVKSCGCKSNYLRGKSNPNNNGNTKNIAYKPWQMMGQRCNNPNYTHYKYYGGRGIKIDPAFKEFSNFLKIVGPRPSLAYTLDRIDSEGNYEPGNVRWVTRGDQVRNRRNTLSFEWVGKNYNLADLARLFNKSTKFFRNHLIIHGRELRDVVNQFSLDSRIEQDPTLFTYKSKEYTIPELTVLLGADDLFWEEHLVDKGMFVEEVLIYWNF